MIKRIFAIFTLVFILSAAPHNVAADIIGPPVFDMKTGGSAMSTLVNSITNMSRTINLASKQMMKIGDMLICNSLRGQAATAKIGVAGFNLEIQLVALDIWLSGTILYVLGFFIALMSSFYMFDVAFNLSLTIVLLPIALAMWPFGWTKDKLRKVVDNILYYVGIFIFLPLGILIAKQLVEEIISSAFGSTAAFMLAFENDEADTIREKLGIFQLPFLKVLISYLVAIKLIPLMAVEFCGHFFGKAQLGNPMSEKLSQGLDILRKKTIGKAGKYAHDVAKHQTGKAIESMGNHDGGFMARTIARYGKSMSKTKKGKG